MSGKLLIFAKLSLKSFSWKFLIYFTLTMKILQIYKKYIIERVDIFHVLTDMDSISLKFMFISGPNKTNNIFLFRLKRIYIIDISDYILDDETILNFDLSCFENTEKNWHYVNDVNVWDEINEDWGAWWVNEDWLINR